jgi:hypothetical protein
MEPCFEEVLVALSSIVAGDMEAQTALEVSVSPLFFL